MNAKLYKPTERVHVSFSPIKHR